MNGHVNCPRCARPLDEDALQVIGSAPGVKGRPASFDIIVDCAACQSRFNTFVPITDFCLLGVIP